MSEICVYVDLCVNKKEKKKKKAGTEEVHNTLQLMRKDLYWIKILSKHTICFGAMYLGKRQPHMQLIRSCKG